jgi:hypothetical protein
LIYIALLAHNGGKLCVLNARLASCASSGELWGVVAVLCKRCEPCCDNHHYNCQTQPEWHTVIAQCFNHHRNDREGSWLLMATALEPSIAYIGALAGARAHYYSRTRGLGGQHRCQSNGGLTLGISGSSNCQHHTALVHLVTATVLRAISAVGRCLPARINMLTVNALLCHDMPSAPPPHSG